MQNTKVRKNFIIDKKLIDEASKILLNKHKNLTEAFVTYLKAVVKEPEILDKIEKSAKKRKGSFIGLLDDKIGNASYKKLREDYLKAKS